MGIQNVLGVDYPYPDEGDKPWGTEHIAWATAVSEGINALQAEIDAIDAEIVIIQADIVTLQGQVGGEVNTSSNEGAGEGLALPKVGVNLPFKTLVAGPNIVLTPGPDTIEIDSVAAGTGDVVGPASSIDNNIAVFDGLTGKLIKDGGTTIAALLALISPTTPNYVQSGVSGNFQTTSSSFVNVPNLSATITNVVGPIKIELQSSSASATFSGRLGFGASNIGEVFGRVRILRNGSALRSFYWGQRGDALSTTVDSAMSLPASAFTHFDPVTPGTYTYSVQVSVNSSDTTLNVNDVRLVVYEVK